MINLYLCQEYLLNANSQNSLSSISQQFLGINPKHAILSHASLVFHMLQLEIPCSPCQPSKLLAVLMCLSIPPSMKPSPHPLADAGAGFCILRNIIAPFSLNFNCFYSSLHYKLLRANTGSSLCFYDT